MSLMYCVCILIALSFRRDVRATTEDTPVVQTSYGPVKGLKFTSNWTNQDIYAFRGIPYAAPPVGALRFQDPVAPEKWITDKDCTEDQSQCPQYFMFGHPKNDDYVTEDCLYLNVYTPKIQQDPGQPLFPVMVWIHGGGFVMGSGNYSHYGPDFLVAEGVIVVTLNYRLGVFGFLSLGTPQVPGNAGLKDQLFALKWVQREIASFGGDAANVSLFGESAGSASVHLHYLSPLSKGLFHRVIGESGAALSSWVVADNPLSYGWQLLKAVNCSHTDLEAAQKCLLEMDAKTLLTAQFTVKPPKEAVRGGQLLAFTPTVDKNSSHPFLPDLPRNLLDKNEGSFVPFLMGVNSDEGMLMVGNNESVSNITNNIEDLIPVDVRNTSTKSQIEFLSKRIRDFYFKDGNPSFSNLRGYIDLYTDLLFGYPTVQSAKSYQQRANSYLYLFSFNGKFKEFFPRKYNFSGVCHAEEMGYIFVVSKINQSVPESSDEMKTWRRMVRMWTNFAKFGSPTPEADPLLQNVIWMPVSNVTTKYLNIGVNLTMNKTNFLSDRMKLWDFNTSSSAETAEALVNDANS